MGSFPDSGFSRGQHILHIRYVFLIQLRYTASGAHGIAFVALRQMNQEQSTSAVGWQIGKRAAVRYRV
jgi:hypothetical protein